ncbi:phage portal protein family protein [Nocardia rhamnosiphila]|uniref:phage portal protein family protein n=3 Tax=Nocardia TaxID=1817 RepID=UPI0007C6CA5B|nr:hypothetical protein [Nocardia rhamnosiphila]
MLNEIGYATEGYSTEGVGFWQAAEETPELRWPLCTRVYRRMERQDAQITSVMRAVTLPVKRTNWRIDPAGARPEVVAHIANDLGLPVVGQPPNRRRRRRGRFSWGEHLAAALLCLRYGHQFFEPVWDVGDDDGLYHLRKLGQRLAETISDIEVAPDGGLVSIEQFGWGAGGAVRIPVERLVAYVVDREGGDWTGQSLLRPAYKHWLIKDRLLRVQAQTIERNGMGVPIYEGGPNDEQPQLDRGTKLAQSYKAGNASGAAIPNGAKLRLLGVEGNLPDAQPAIDYHDAQIGRSVLAHFLNLGNSTGSWALGTTFADFFVMSLQTVAEMIRDTAQAHIIEDLVDANWGPDEVAPQLVFDEIGSRKDATAAALEILVRAGIITPDEAIEQAARQDYGLPIRQAVEGDELVEHQDREDTAAAVAARMARMSRDEFREATRTRATMRRIATEVPPSPRARIEPDGALTLW